jgi:hypothetical protein
MIEKTAPYLLCQRAKMLSESVAWFDAFKFNNLKGQIIDWIQNDQLMKKGVDENDEVIGYYSFVTQQISKGKKKFNEPYNLKDTGDFYRSMFVRVFLDAFTVNADADKMEDKEWWREEILGLTDESLSKFVEQLRNSYIRYARKVLFNR